MLKHFSMRGLGLGKFTRIQYLTESGETYPCLRYAIFRYKMQSSDANAVIRQPYFDHIIEAGSWHE